MYLISARKGFWSDTELAVRDAIKKVDLVGDRPSTDVDDHDAFCRIFQVREYSCWSTGITTNPKMYIMLMPP